jgi:hypothetical protein
MFTYKFRMNFEEQDGFSRDIELLTDQSFLDFHTIIGDNLSLDKSVECTFYMCDHRYRKRKRIYQPGNTEALKPPAEGQEPEKKLFMDECTLSDYIDDPHQKFIYIYDIDKDWSFYIELLKISKASDGAEYPKIAASIGGVPLEISRKPVVLPGLSDEDDDVADTRTGDDEDDEDGHEMEMVIEDEGEDDEGSQIFGEEDVDGMDDIDDSAFYDGSIGVEDFDEGKL